MIKFLVTWDISKNVDRMRLHREIRRAATETGIERIGGSVYVVSGIDAAIRAHVIAELAARCGAGNVGESDGPTVLQLDDEKPNDYFANRDLAHQIADELLLDHRKYGNKSRTRSILVIVGQIRESYLGSNIINFAKILKERRSQTEYKTVNAELGLRRRKI